MIKKILIFFSIISFILIHFNVYANSQRYRDELPDLKKLSDLTIGIKRIEKGLKYESKGKMEKANKMYSESIDFLLKANKKRKISADLFFYLGFAYNKLKKFSDAEIYYVLGLTLEPNHLIINKNLGLLYLDQKKIDKAEKVLFVLKNCNCKEYLDLKNKIKAFKN
jgi:tetratricopeptide (TPR) repeat protein